MTTDPMPDKDDTSTAVLWLRAKSCFCVACAYWAGFGLADEAARFLI